MAYFSKWLIKAGEAFQSPLLLLMRLYWGISFAHSGWGKLIDIASIANYFESLGIPWPTLNAYMAGTAELVGGVLLIVGLLSRLAAIPLTIVMLTAFATAHMDALKGLVEDPYELLKQTPFTYLLCALIVFAFGPGKWSLDHWLGLERKEQS